MEIFRELNKKGYKHYYGGTIEELDNMDKNNPDLHSEIMQVVMWLYEKHGIWITPIPRLNSWIFSIVETKTSNHESLIDIDFYGSNAYLISKGIPTIMMTPTEAYLEAIKYCLTKLI